MADHNRSRQLDWEDLRVLVELAHHGSLSATARALGVTHVTVSRRIANLEADLAQPLFVREAGRYVPTDAGKRIVHFAAAMAENAEAIVRTASGMHAKIAGPVRVTATEAVASYIVMPSLAEIRSRYPEVDIDLRITQLNLNLGRSDADIAVRLAKPAAGAGVVGEKVADLQYHLYASESYLAKCTPGDFEYIGYQMEFADWPESKALEAVSAPGRTAMRINHLSCRIEAARLGLGVALIPSVMADAWPELVRVSSDAPVMEREVWVLVHEDLRDVPRIRAAVDVLTQVIGSRHGSGRDRS